MTAPVSAFETPDTGLTDAEVRDRVARGQTNEAGERTSRTYSEIIRANIFTRFNAILGTMLAVILAVGEIQDATFGIVLVANSLIGIVQEIRAKRTLDRLAVLSAPRAGRTRRPRSSRSRSTTSCSTTSCELQTGDQVPADGVVRSVARARDRRVAAHGRVRRRRQGAGAEVLSGSFVVAGSGRFQATAVGADAYARQLAAEARRFTRTRSELVEGINIILRSSSTRCSRSRRCCSGSSCATTTSKRPSIGIVAGVVGMVPEGLVLLTSLAFGIAAVTLARRNVLVQELPAVEVLAASTSSASTRPAR